MPGKVFFAPRYKYARRSVSERKCRKGTQELNGVVFIKEMSVHINFCDILREVTDRFVAVMTSLQEFERVQVWKAEAPWLKMADRAAGIREPA